MAREHRAAGGSIEAGVGESDRVEGGTTAEAGAADLQVGVGIADRELAAEQAAIAGRIRGGDAERIGAIAVRSETAAGGGGGGIQLPEAIGGHGEAPAGAATGDLQQGSGLAAALEQGEVERAGTAGHRGDGRDGVDPQLSCCAVADAGAVGILHRGHHVVEAIAEGLGAGNRQAPVGTGEHQLRRTAEGVGAAINSDAELVGGGHSGRATDHRSAVVGDLRRDRGRWDRREVVVDDREGGAHLAGEAGAAGGIGEGEGEGLIPFDEGIVGDGDRHGATGFTVDEQHRDLFEAVVGRIGGRAGREKHGGANAAFRTTQAIDGDRHHRLAILPNGKIGGREAEVTSGGINKIVETDGEGLLSRQAAVIGGAHPNLMRRGGLEVKAGAVSNNQAVARCRSAAEGETTSSGIQQDQRLAVIGIWIAHGEVAHDRAVWTVFVGIALGKTDPLGWSVHNLQVEDSTGIRSRKAGEAVGVGGDHADGIGACGGRGRIEAEAAAIEADPGRQGAAIGEGGAVAQSLTKVGVAEGVEIKGVAVRAVAVDAAAHQRLLQAGGIGHRCHGEIHQRGLAGETAAVAAGPVEGG